MPYLAGIEKWNRSWELNAFFIPVGSGSRAFGHFRAFAVLPLQYGVPEPGRGFRAFGKCLRSGGKRGGA
jgi:hypothetical protein